MAGSTVGAFVYVIVGTGTAGCVLANRLSADPKVNALLLESRRPPQTQAACKSIRLLPSMLRRP